MSDELVNISPTPPSPAALKTYSVFGIKAATPDLLVNDSLTLPPEIQEQMILEEIGGQELINISRHDLINGQNIKYSPIKNIASISTRYNSRNIIPVQNTSNSIFNNFSIKLEEFLPAPGTNDGGSYVANLGTGPNGESIYIDETTGDLTINLVNVQKDQQVEVQIVRNTGVISATIYEEEL
jgi:hypothetical protein